MSMKIAVAMMVKDFTTPEPLSAFMANAKAFGHPVGLILLGWQNSCSQEALNTLSAEYPVKAIPLRQAEPLGRQLSALGLSQKHQTPLLPSADVAAGMPMPYGLSRNQLLIAALLEGVELLYYIDDDVFPTRLKDDGSFEELDFFGGHLRYLEAPDTLATTSDYTGFDIVPQLPVDRWQDFLHGLGKPPQMGLKYTAKSPVHTNVRETDKLLGGNLALKLSGILALGGFYSTVLDFEGQRYLGRGEDTLLGLAIAKSQKGRAVDIDMRIFHNAFKDYPKSPDLLSDPRIKDRFFYAAMGWIARNPLLEVLNERSVDWRLRQHNLSQTAPEVAEALNDPRFLMLPDAMVAAHNQLEREKRRLDDFMEAWQALGRCLQ